MRVLDHLSGVSNGSEYTQSFYWLEILIYEIVVGSILLYFLEINPRKHVMIFVEKNIRNTVLLSLAASMCFLALLALGMVVAILVPDDTFIKFVLIVVWLLMFPVAYYIFFYRGISIYKNKKIRIFNFKVTTYQNGFIEDVKVEKFEKHSKLTIVINGKENVFWISSKYAQHYQDKIRKTMCFD